MMMMKSIFQPAVRHDVARRLDALRPDTAARWGRMSAHQAVCHLADALRMVLGERPIAMQTNLVARTAIRLFALTLPVAWPRGVATAPEIDQASGGTTPTSFDADREALATLIDRFVATDGRNLNAHPIFGPLTRGEWGRWGYRHLDHHLTQFGL